MLIRIEDSDGVRSIMFTSLEVLWIAKIHQSFKNSFRGKDVRPSKAFMTLVTQIVVIIICRANELKCALAYN